MEDVKEWFEDDCLYYIQVKFFDHRSPHSFQIRESDSVTAIIKVLSGYETNDRKEIISAEVVYVGD